MPRLAPAPPPRSPGLPALSLNPPLPPERDHSGPRRPGRPCGRGVLGQPSPPEPRGRLVPEQAWPYFFQPRCALPTIAGDGWRPARGGDAWREGPQRGRDPSCPAGTASTCGAGCRGLGAGAWSDGPGGSPGSSRPSQPSSGIHRVPW